MRFACLGYFDEAQWNTLSPETQESMFKKCMAYDAVLRKNGHYVGGEALHSANETVTLKMKNGQAVAIDGPYAETKEYIGGILMLEARDMKHATELMLKHPGVAIGPFEIRAIDSEFMAKAEALMEAAK
ncbi:YciI family protein [Usitatibacter palustris]|uniref:YCII-related domain-containing protein n=1 Tax=Usitatibacter palustris TaxID=2732487 RepID=A0A6M4H9M4_9PROT|nr:YciI family protein [Usitatibacter palustris]QJR15094.1 hypothetical protein DSM104440_01910 [Usitatibacter palustris]